MWTIKLCRIVQRLLRIRCLGMINGGSSSAAHMITFLWTHFPCLWHLIHRCVSIYLCTDPIAITVCRTTLRSGGRSQKVRVDQYSNGDASASGVDLGDDDIEKSLQKMIPDGWIRRFLLESPSTRHRIASMSVEPLLSFLKKWRPLPWHRMPERNRLIWHQKTRTWSRFEVSGLHIHTISQVSW